MIKITNGKYDENYFNSMIPFELKKYFKSFSSYEDFIKKEKIPFIKKDYFDNWFFHFSFFRYRCRHITTKYIS